MPPEGWGGVGLEATGWGTLSSFLKSPCLGAPAPPLASHSELFRGQVSRLTLSVGLWDSPIPRLHLSLSAVLHVLVIDKAPVHP